MYFLILIFFFLFFSLWKNPGTVIWFLSLQAAVLFANLSFIKLGHLFAKNTWGVCVSVIHCLKCRRWYTHVLIVWNQRGHSTLPWESQFLSSSWHVRWICFGSYFLAFCIKGQDLQGNRELEFSFPLPKLDANQSYRPHSMYHSWGEEIDSFFSQGY